MYPTSTTRRHATLLSFVLPLWATCRSALGRTYIQYGMRR